VYNIFVSGSKSLIFLCGRFFYDFARLYLRNQILRADMVQKEVVFLKGKACIYYSNKGKVLRLATGILWNDRWLPPNEKLINDLVKKLQDIVWNYRLDHDGGNPSRDFVRSMMKGESVPKECLMDYYREFLDYKTQEVTDGNLLTKRNLNNNSAHKRMKLLKAFLNYCEGKRYFRLDFNFSKIKMKGYNPTVISLTELEYCNLRDWDAGKYEKVKAVFIFRGGDNLLLKTFYDSLTKTIKTQATAKSQIVSFKYQKITEKQELQTGTVTSTKQEQLKQSFQFVNII
jgi:hypothetical protein